ncbi:Peptidase, M20/M25/M40 family [Pseudomonas syringae pv. papulans]|nr:Peptidase, M20/M25/M40 family [Pseudomonas syringae pv. papulans]RMN43444.1 Peptidase, M20/M25/M40 family [Pseudomonas syringae pv. papulans]RMN86212.1 Peptidase, M20/M25/M40 family [Pseudomonas syringae pv. papulans]RMV40049.1 Glutamate carboxypeptidase [Pseudomonas syringae pv. papulans]
MHSRRFPLTAAIGLSLVSMGLFSMAANAAELSPDQLLKKAQAEQPAYLDTVRQLVDIDTGTGQAPGLKTVSAMLVERLKALGAEVSTTPADPSAGGQYRRHVQRQRHAFFSVDGPLRHGVRAGHCRQASLQARQRARLWARGGRCQGRRGDDSARTAVVAE